MSSATIYTAVSVIDGKPDNTFSARKLNMAPGAFPDVGIYALPSSRENASMKQLSGDIHMFLAAELYDMVYAAESPMLNVLKDIPERAVHVVPPACQITLSERPDNEELLQFRELGMERDNQSKKTALIGSPSLTDFLKLIGKIGGPKKQGSPKGHVSAFGYLAFFTAWKAVAGFSRVVYSLAQPKSSEKIYIFPPITATMKVGMEHGKEVSIVGGFGGKEEFAYKAVVEDGQKVTGFKLVTPPQVVYTPMARPSWGGWSYRVSEGALPTGWTGFLFPYFNGLLVPTKEFLGNEFFANFSRCIASTADQMRDAAPLLREGLRELSITPAGMELQHVYFGINLSIQLRARFRVYVEAKHYLGFALINPCGEILNKNTIVQAYDAKEFNLAVATLSARQAALAGIKALLALVETELESVEEISFEEVTSSRALVRLLHRFRFEDLSDDNKSILKAHLSNVTFDETYWECTPENISTALSHLAKKKKLPMDVPFYTGKGLALSRDHIVEVLSAFGPTGPSFYSGSSERKVAALSKKDPNLAEFDGRRSLQYLPVMVVAIATAVAHMRAVIKQKEIRFHPPRKSVKEFCNRSTMKVILTEKFFDNAYNSLRELCHAEVSEQGPSRKSKKRKETAGGAADDDVDMDDVPGPSKSKKTKLSDLF